MMRSRREADAVLEHSRELQRKLDEMALTLDEFVHALQGEVDRLTHPDQQEESPDV